MAIHLGRPLPDASRDLPEQRCGNPPCRANAAAVPTWSCSRWGLPCRFRYRNRGALLPHPFTLACRPYEVRTMDRRFAFCGTFPGVASAGRYPAPYLRGARTFLPSGIPEEWPSDRLTVCTIEWFFLYGKFFRLHGMNCSARIRSSSPCSRSNSSGSDTLLSSWILTRMTSRTSV